MSNKLVRILTGIVGIPLLVFLIVAEGWFYFALAIIVSSLCLWEFHKLFIHKGFSSHRILSIALSIIVVTTSFIEPKLSAFIFLFTLFVLTSTEIFREQRNPVNLFISLSGIVYITLPFVLTFQLNEMYSFKPVLLMIILVWVCDTAAYFLGMKFGKHKLSEISPKKTWEGSIGGFIFSLIAAFVYREFFDGDLTEFDAVVIGIIGGTATQIGDLFESMLKRYTEVKDSSDIIPGHGGFLDRFDSFLFITVPVYLYLAYIKPVM